MAKIVAHETLTLLGLDQPAEILIDSWGIPHIYAGTQCDAFLVQGWNIARDRLWQLDLWRKRGLGRLAETFGPAYAARDRAARLFLYRGDMEAEWAVYGDQAKAWSAAFVAGINAYVERTRAGEAPLPVEFGLTGSSPDLWSVEDLVRIRSHGLSRNVEYEVARARVFAAGGLGADRLRRRLQPDHERRAPEGVDPADIPADVLADYLLATQPMLFDAPGAGGPAFASREPVVEGSNNWAVAPSRTASGRPMLASDPHRVMQAPSIRYIAHLEAPGLSVIGAGEPHLPGVTLGHNGQIAFGITIFMADQEDLYVYELNPDDPRQYRYGNGWEPMRVVRETVPVKGGADREIELAFTRHGPVLKIDTAAGRAFALRSVWFEPGTSSYFAAARYQTVDSWEGFKEALRHWRAASMNFVYADVAGNIGWIPTGMMPKRPNWDGLTPVPGDGRHEWAGFVSPEELPCVFNPDRGWVATANELNLPPDWPFETHNIGYEWSDPSRAIVIEAALAANDRMTLADSMALQLDDHSVTAARAVALLRGLTSPDPRLTEALDVLAAWDGRESIDSIAATIAEVWLNKHLPLRAIAQMAGPAVARAAAAAGHISPLGAICTLETPDRALADDPSAARTQVLLESLAAALDEIAARLGPDMTVWRWGALHQAHLVPPAAAFADPALRAKMSHGPIGMPGSATTPRAATFEMENFTLTSGASFRMVLDVGAWDNSVAINTPGQSGDPASPHYADLFEPWARGAFVPLLYSRAAVEGAAQRIIQLVPQVAELLCDKRKSDG